MKRGRGEGVIIIKRISVDRLGSKLGCWIYDFSGMIGAIGCVKELFDKGISEL